MTVTSANILVIDDNPEQSARLTEPFANWGWGVTRLPGAIEPVLEHVTQQPCDLALVDIRAAERDGFALLKALRAEPASARLPVVITAREGTSVARLARCIEHGASDYIAHPDQHVLMRARLQNVLQRKLLEEQANTALEAFNEIEKIADDLRLIILPIGAALSEETEYERLVARIVEEAQGICNADAGVLYLAREDGFLHPIYLRIQSLNYVQANLAGESEGLSALPLTAPGTGEPNYDLLPVFVALRGETVNLLATAAGRFDLDRFLTLPDHLAFRAVSCLSVPLRSGQVIGALVLCNSRHPLSGEVMPFDAYHQQVAESLASQAAIVLNNRLLNERQAQLMRYKRELEIGREIQLSFLPHDIPNPEGWQLKARFQPAQEVAGDFYDAFALPHGHIALVIADVVGKGVTAALFMAIIRSLFRALFQQNYFQTRFRPVPATGGAIMAPFPFVDRDALLNAVRLTNAYLIANHSDTYAFATLCAGILDPLSGRLAFVNAGHNPPLILRRGPADRRKIAGHLSPTGPALGLMREANYRLDEVQLLRDDLVFAYTDGLTESRSPSGEEFGFDRLVTVLGNAEGSADEILEAVMDALRAHVAGEEAFDDVTMLALLRVATLEGE